MTPGIKKGFKKISNAIRSFTIFPPQRRCGFDNKIPPMLTSESLALLRERLMVPPVDTSEANSQSTSLFFRLPPEIRNMIYQYALGVNPKDVPDNYSLHRTDVSLGIPELNAYNKQPNKPKPQPTIGMKPVHLTNTISMYFPRPHQASPAILRLCRRTYAEALPYLYAREPVFHKMSHVLYFLTSIGAAGRAQLRTLRLHDLGRWGGIPVPGMDAYEAFTVIKLCSGLERIIVHDSPSSLLWDTMLEGIEGVEHPVFGLPEQLEFYLRIPRLPWVKDPEEEKERTVTVLEQRMGRAVAITWVDH